MKTPARSKINVFLNNAGRKGLTFNELKSICRVTPKQVREFRGEVEALVEDGSIALHKNKYFLPKILGLFAARITRNSKTFLFAVRLDNEAEVFIPGRFGKGAVTEDLVFLQPIKQLGASEEGMVFSIYKNGPSTFTGVLLQEEEQFKVLPDTLSKDTIPVEEMNLQGAKAGDKVIARIVRRGDRHRNHTCEVLSSHGSAETAIACAKTILECSGVNQEFPAEVLDLAAHIANKGISLNERKDRMDLRGETIFTIDGADSMDLDDAISLERIGDYYRLGVHIADVSHYVKAHSALDEEAFTRGTSIYFANQVIPMLPKELSNGICSLNPKEDRLAFSAILTLSLQGELVDFDFKKSVIKSVVKGVYSEVNQILTQTAEEAVTKKYEAVLPTLALMHELYQTLRQNKINRGAPQLVTRESKIVINDQNIAVDILPRTQGVSEGMIEEFMLLANEAAATLATRKQLPFVYRVHEYPSPEKLTTLKEILQKLGLSAREIKPKTKPGVLAKILDSARETNYFPIINTQVLRSMAKAKYSPDPIGHFGLALDNYAHFTSPIRRYPDLTIHRILNDCISGTNEQAITKRYGKFVAEAAHQSTATELIAMRIERDCDDCYKAEYMHGHIDEEFEGIISSVLSRGFYVELANTVEGYVKTESLGGAFEYDGFTQLKDAGSGKVYRIGDPVNVRCTKADVNAGNIDFIVCE